MTDHHFNRKTNCNKRRKAIIGRDIAAVLRFFVKPKLTFFYEFRIKLNYLFVV
jgi:hypothetical protein